MICGAHPTRMKRLIRALVVALGLGAPGVLGACEVALVVALDVSRSVDKFEYRLMRDGIASAFLEEDVIEMISFLPGGILVSVTQWGGDAQQRVAVRWHRLDGRATIIPFVERFVAQTRGYWMADTSISSALIHADQTLANAPDKCRRRVIDISGDGISNAGPDVAPISRAIGTKGITVNGLVVTGARPDPVRYFLTHVIEGPQAFVEVAATYSDYSRAMKRKLLRELSLAVASAR